MNSENTIEEYYNIFVSGKKLKDRTYDEIENLVETKRSDISKLDRLKDKIEINKIQKQLYGMIIVLSDMDSK